MLRSLRMHKKSVIGRALVWSAFCHLLLFCFKFVLLHHCSFKRGSYLPLLYLQHNRQQYLLSVPVQPQVSLRHSGGEWEQIALNLRTSAPCLLSFWNLTNSGIHFTARYRRITFPLNILIAACLRNRSLSLTCLRC